MDIGNLGATFDGTNQGATLDNPAPDASGGFDPEIQSYLSMLGIGQPQGAVQQQPAAVSPVAASFATQTPVAQSPATQFALPAWLGLGISGQKAGMMPVIPGHQVNYTPPAPPQQKSSGGGSGIGGMLGGFL